MRQTPRSLIADLTFQGPTALPHLLLPQNDDSPGFDRVPRCQVVASPQLRTILIRLPLAIPCGPGDADVVPPSITYLQRQLGNLRSKYIILNAALHTQNHMYGVLFE